MVTRADGNSFAGENTYLEKNLERFVEDLKTLVRQPSVAAQNLGMEKCAELLRDMLLDIGLDTKIIPLKGGPPLVFAETKVHETENQSSRRKTLLFYGHYDVVPPEPLDRWAFDPFSATTSNGRIIGRGTADSKGNVVALMKALECLLATRPNLPVKVKLIFEGEEEIGSSHFVKFVNTNKKLLSADAAVNYDGKLHESNRPRLVLGSPGGLVVKLVCKGARYSPHIGQGRLIVNPAWRMIWALSGLKKENEIINMEGFYDDVVPPSSESIRMAKRIPYAIEEGTQRKDFGIKSYLQGLSGFKAVKADMFDPTCNIEGFQSGYIGPGFNTSLPNDASAVIDFRLVPGQDPKKIFAVLKENLRRRGFGDIELNKLAQIKPEIGAPPNSPIVRCVAASMEEVYKVKPVLKPMLGGWTPVSQVFTKLLRMDSVSCGCGPAFSNTHAPNEFTTQEHFMQGIKLAISIVRNFAEPPHNKRK